MPLYYAIGLLLIFYVLLVGEFCLPTGGLMGIAAAAAAVAAVVIAFTHSVTAGIVMLIILGASTPIVFISAVRLWPHTPIGKRVLNRRPGQAGEIPQRTLADGTPLRDLVGRLGVAATDLLPAGRVVIGAQKVDAVSVGMPIDRGAQVVVTKVVAGRIQVRPANRKDVDSAGKTSDSETGKPQSPPSLEEPLESFDLDTLS
jgi:membrane-bound ClpP family serine protease